MCCILSPQALGKICRLWLPCTECVIFGTDKQWLFWEAQAVHFFLSFIRSHVAFKGEEQHLMLLQVKVMQGSDVSQVSWGVKSST